MSAHPEILLGARVDGNAVTFTVWAPRQRSLALRLGEDEMPMVSQPDGYFSLTVPRARAGQHYWYRLEEGLRPDPASRYQPEGPFGPSVIVDPSTFQWTDQQWPGAPPRHRQVLYEMHIGTFTSSGTWAGARERVSALAELGVTTLEIMPLAEFSGRFGWGYDGVFLFAPFHEYGSPDDVRQFVDEAHGHGLAVILDVVYNHLGPVGNFLSNFSDWYFAEHETDWGRGFNIDGDHSTAVRQFMRSNVRHWISEYHFDGLRFDATQSIVDRSPEHLISELTRCARDTAQPKRLFIVAENEPQDVAFLNGDDQANGGLDSIWNEDWHHAAYAAATGQNEAYCTDYDGTAHEFAAMARWNLLYQGQWYSWQKQPRGTDSRAFPSSAFVCFLENHDQVANTGRGARLHQFTHKGRWRAMVSMLLLGPALPMLFQGQEAATRSPFTYFADHEGELAGQVRRGRLEFLSQFPSLNDPDVQQAIPDPADASGFATCKIDWCASVEAGEATRLHMDLLALRRLDPVLSNLGSSAVQIASSALTSSVLLMRYSSDEGERLVLINLGFRARLRMNDPLLAPPRDRRWMLSWCSEHVRYGGAGVADVFGDGPWTLQGNCAWLFEANGAHA